MEKRTSASVKPQKSNGMDLTSGSIPRLIIYFSLPMLAGNIIQTAYSIINAMWVGKGLGKVELAAVTVGMPIIFLLNAIAIGLTIGTSILVSQFAGAKNWVQLKKVVQTSTIMLMALSGVLLIAGEFTTPYIIKLMNTPDNIFKLSVGYMRIFLLSIPFTYGVFLVVSLLRGVGDSKTPLYFQAGSLAATAILDPILMFGWLGFPRLGLNGTAVASVAMQGLGMAATFIYLSKKDHIVMPDWRKLYIDWPMFRLVVKIGLPSAVQQALVSVGMLVLTGIINQYGENATAAFGAGMRIDQLAILPALTFNASVATMVGQNIGAGRLHRIKAILLWGLAICGGITLCASTVALTAPHILLKMFINDPIVMREGASYLRIVSTSYMFFAVLFISNGVINGSGHTMITTAITLISLWLARLPLAVFLSHRLQSVEGVWYAILIGSIIGMILSLICYFSGIWKRSVVKHDLAIEEE